MTFDDFNLSKTGDGLLPVIIQDATTLKVLMLGYMDRAAFDKTVEEGRVTFFSRSKSRKGASPSSPAASSGCGPRAKPAATS